MHDDISTDVLCKHCGFAGRKHRTGDARCPAGEAFPKWPTTVKDEVKAGALFDKRLAKYWAARATTFTRCDR